MATARPGGVLIHCAGGRDRAELVSLLLLALVGVAPAEIAADYELGAERLRPLYERLGWGDVNGRVDKLLAATRARATRRALAVR